MKWMKVYWIVLGLAFFGWNGFQIGYWRGRYVKSNEVWHDQELDRVFKEGRLARDLNSTAQANPYIGNEEKAVAWFKGWKGDIFR